MNKHLSMVLGMLCSCTVFNAFSHDFQLNTNIDYSSAYISNGMQCGEHSAFLNASLDQGPWTIGVTFVKAIAGSEKDFNDELDLYFSYQFTITEKVNLDVGAVYYTVTEDNSHKQNSGVFWKEKTFMPYISVSFGEQWGTPSLTYEHDLDAETSYARADFEREFPITSQFSLIAEAGIGYAWDVTNNLEDKDYSFGHTGLKLEYRMNNFSAYTGFNMSIASKDNFYSRNDADMLQQNKQSLPSFFLGASAYF